MAVLGHSWECYITLQFTALAGRSTGTFASKNMSDTNANPFKWNLINPVTLKLSSGSSIDVPRCSCRFRRWEGEPISYRGHGKKPLIEFDCQPVFAELAILGTLRQDGWDGVWVDTYRNTFRRGVPPDSCDLPSRAQALYDRICLENDGKQGGCFDVFVWRDQRYLFVESKWRAKDVLQNTQKEWIKAALRVGVPMDSLLICEWDFPPTGATP
jgi:hypothetical protein